MILSFFLTFVGLLFVLKVSYAFLPSSKSFVSKAMLFQMNSNVPDTDSSPFSPNKDAQRNLKTSGLSIFSGMSGLLIATNFPQKINAASSQYPIKGDESLMAKKAHGTTDIPVQSSLRWNVDQSLADRICSYNRRWAENYGYWLTTSFLKEENGDKEITFYDSVTGKPLFIAPRNRSFTEWKDESSFHGWPSFRDQEVVWENVRCLKDGETVSLAGTHLGHNLPDFSGNRYCINLVSVAGRPSTTA
mmetsp:Transcript_29034/g.29378  ORF Transcript_29034/g.29378 Transcript_29034/m.29378 type:complete len:246 (+) Transcript_29034:56-793(+)